MTHLIYGNELQILSIDPNRETANCKIKMVEIDTVETEEGAMRGCFGGFGGEQTKQLPLKKVLTPKELKHWQWLKWLFKGQYNSIDFTRERKAFFEQVKSSPRISRAKGMASSGRLLTGIVSKR